jgi:lysozyme family protein
MISREVFFRDIVPFTLKYEGGYANAAGDRGGETYRGISRVYNPNWHGWATVDARKPLRSNAIIPDLEADVKQYYWDKYFSPFGFALLASAKVALALFDFRVHGGYSAAKFKAAVSGQTGRSLSTAATITASDAAVLNRIAEKTLAAIVQRLRNDHLATLIRKDPSQAKFAEGWASRMGQLSSVLGIIRRHPLRTAAAVGAAVMCITAYILFRPKK